MQGEVKKRKGNIVQIVCVLLALAVVCACLVVGISARFTSEGIAGDDARVATFSINDDDTLTEPITADLAPGDSETVDLKIKNDSEVDIEYTVTVSNETNNLPLELSLVQEDPEGSSTPITTSSGATSLTLGGTQDIGSDKFDTYTLTIKWPTTGEDGKELNGSRDSDLMGRVDRILVTVTATQID